jgi:hypothetical protein
VRSSCYVARATSKVAVEPISLGQGCGPNWNLHSLAYGAAVGQTEVSFPIGELRSVAYTDAP